MRASDRIELEASTLSPAGDGLADLSGIQVHVPGVFPGEQAAARVEHVSRQHPRAHARLLEILRPHPARRAPPCPHCDSGAPPRPGLCSGCPLQALDLAAQRALKLDALHRLGLSVDTLVGDEREFGYRWSSKRVVTGTSGQPIVGSYVRGTHTPARMDDCRIDHPAIAAAARELQEVAATRGIEPYDEATGAGDLRYVWLKTDGAGVLLTLITAARPSRAADELPSLLKIPAGIAWSVQSGRGNAVRGEPAVHLSGKPALTVSVAGVDVDVGPLGFLQPNPPIAGRCYLDLVTDHHGEPLTGARAFDLYAGTGVTTALLRRNFAEVVPCEEYPESAARLGVAPETAEAFLAREHAPPDLVVANPPRGGLGPEVCARLAHLRAPKLNIMSCSAEALKRDLTALEAGGYALRRLRAYDTLPQTPHVELVAWLELQ
jgi:23S rRNA (uracil1939-C5)-methyltransferase